MPGDSWAERIVVDARRMGGNPCVRGTRITVSMIVGSLADGDSPQDLLDAYPQLTIADIRAALRYASECMRTSFVVPLAG